MVGADRGGYLLCGAYFPEVCAGCRLQAAGSPFPVLSGDPNCHDSPLDCPSVRVGTWLRSAGGGAGRKRRFCQLPPFVGLCPLGLTDALGGVAGGESHASSRWRAVRADRGCRPRLSCDGPRVLLRSEAAGATDAQCNRPVVYDYQYMPSGGGGFQPYDPNNPPSNVGTTTTDQGKTVPYIVRRETGSQDRGQYQIAVLFDPTKSWAPWAPQ